MWQAYGSIALMSLGKSDLTELKMALDETASGVL